MLNIPITIKSIAKKVIPDLGRINYYEKQVIACETALCPRIAKGVKQ
jgi:hypothetical protein